MKRIRVSIGDLQSGILRDILAHITEREEDMELITRRGPADFTEAIRRDDVDVVICDVRLDELPAVARALFAAGDCPVVVGLAREGREAAICIADAGAAQLMSVIRSAIADTGKVVTLRSADADKERVSAEPYPSNAACLADQLRSLDLAILGEVDALEATVWDESLQRLQGLAISPAEVRALLDPDGPQPPARAAGEARRKRQRLVEVMQKRLAATAPLSSVPAFARLVDRFALGPFEQLCLTAALAIEIDRNKYGKAFALLQDDVTRKQPSLDLLLRLHERAGDSDRWDAAKAFDASAPLRRWQLVRFPPREPGEPATSLGRRVEIDERIACYLLDLRDLGSPLEDFVALGLWNLDTLRVPPDAALEEQLARLVGDVRRGSPAAPPRALVHVYGRSGAGRRSLVAAVCQRHGLGLVRIDAGRLPSLPPGALDEALRLLERESALEPCALCFENFDALLEEDPASAAALRVLLRGLPDRAPVTFFVGTREWTPDGLVGEGAFQSVSIPLPPPDRARAIWLEELAEVDLDPSATAEEMAGEVAGRFSLSPGQIHDAVCAARTGALWRRPDRPWLTLRDLYRGCQDQCSHKLRQLTRPVSSPFGWDDLILPPPQRDQLRELELAIRNTASVLGDWHFDTRLAYGRGITALFAGPSGTGKTMAAGILAHELGLELYTIDLSRVVSKYIGETEKNLDRIFQQAEDASAMLFFDEADALFGKRSAIKDAHDRYANIEIAYLLQKMEERAGPTILATNMRTNIDEAFSRRIRFLIEFQMPDQAHRLDIWRRLLPAGAPLAPDVDLRSLAMRLRFSGGSIMNVCVGAASLAYTPGGAIHMRHMLHAAKREMQKLGQQYNPRDFESGLAGAAVGAAEGDS
jgi:winged helix domain-containing protein/ATPase family protein associated with various cellular activities (AAA)